MDICSFFSMIICRSIEADLILRRRFRHTKNLLFRFGGFFAITFLRGLLLRNFTELQILKFGFSKMAIKICRNLPHCSCRYGHVMDVREKLL